MDRDSFIEFVQHLNYLMSAATLQMSIQTKSKEANDYIEKYIPKALWGSNPWHIILDDATKLREDRSIKARTIAVSILTELDMNLMCEPDIQKLTDIIKKELENGK